MQHFVKKIFVPNEIYSSTGCIIPILMEVARDLAKIGKYLFNLESEEKKSL